METARRSSAARKPSAIDTLPARALLSWLEAVEHAHRSPLVETTLVTIRATPDPRVCLCQRVGWLCYLVALFPAPASGQEPMRDAIAVVNRKALSADRIECERIALGEPDDYKPRIALLPSGELLLTAFHPYEKEKGK